MTLRDWGRENDVYYGSSKKTLSYFRIITNLFLAELYELDFYSGPYPIN